MHIGWILEVVALVQRIRVTKSVEYREDSHTAILRPRITFINPERSFFIHECLRA